MKKNVISIVILLALAFTYATSYAVKYDPGPGKTVLLIGQTFKSEYQGFANGMGLTPAGGSHYATLYLGKIEQGDDDPNSVFLDYIRGSQSNPYALIALSIKDNTAAGGYGQMINPAWDGFNSNAVWDALQAINSGQWDSKIDDFGNLFAARPDVKFYVRVGYEVSLLLFAYKGSQYVNDWLNDQANQGINVFENPDQIPDLDRHAYINAYNRIAQRIKAKASNVAFVYHPVRGFNDTKWLYPGDQNVDYVGFSIFNNDICMEVNGTFNCQGQTIDPNLQQSMQFAQSKGKPLMIAESAAQAPATNSSSTFQTYLSRLHNVITSFDVRVLAYINSNWPAHGWDANWGDSRIEVNSSVKNYWLSTYGNGTRYLYSNSTPPPPSCTDGIQNGDETGVDCGGSCPPCQGTCSDGIQNQGETGVDCGGPCPPCQTNDCTDPSCPPTHPVYLCNQCWESEAQASSGGCNETCDDPPPPPTCSDGIQNQGETGVDCGGPCPPCQTDDVLEALDFENDLEDWIQVSGYDTHDWTVRSGGTPSNNTGPSSANQGTYYAYLETSSGYANSSGNNARLNSPSVNGATQLTFDYHMRGDNIGTLYIDVNPNNSGWDQNVWSKSGAQGSSWNSATVNLSQYTNDNIVVRFRAVAAGGWQGDIAIDDIKILGSDVGPTCTDGIQNGDETGVDCGGSCPPCAPTCTDGIQNGDETGVDCGGSCPPCDDNELFNGVAKTNLSGAQGSEAVYFINVPSGAANLEIEISGGSGDADLYTRFGSAPTTGTYDCRPYKTGNNEICTVSSPQVGKYYVMLRGYAAYSGLTLVASFDLDGPTCNDGIQNGDETGIDCGGSCPPCNTDDPLAGAKLLPPNKKILSSIGQDLKTENDYITGGVNQRGFPTPGSVVAYISFWTLDQAVYPEYGALGEDPSGNPLGYDIDWGAGPLNARNAADGYPESALVLALSIAEGSDPGDVWCAGCISGIGSGQYDSQIHALANFCKRHDEPIYLRIGFEFDGKWNLGYSNTTAFKNAWKRIVDVMNSDGVTNVAYVWQSCASPIDDILEGYKENINDWYPGDNYVDWVGLSWFLLPNETAPVGGTVSTQLELADEVVNFARAHNKPVMIAESTPQGYDVENMTLCNISPVWDGGAKTGCQNLSASQLWGQWFTPYFNYIYGNKDVIRHVTYINVNWEDDTYKFGSGSGYAEGYWGRAGVHVNSTIANNWKTEMNKSDWMHGGPNNNGVLKSADAILSVKEVETSGITLSPIPVKTMLTINGVDELTPFKVVDITGALLMEGKGNKLNVSHLNSGVYILMTGDTHLRFIKQ